MQRMKFPQSYFLGHISTWYATLCTKCKAKEWMYSAIKRFTQLVLQFLRRHIMHEHSRPSCTRYFLVNHPTTKMIQHLYVICTFEVSLSNVLSNKIS